MNFNSNSDGIPKDPADFFEWVYDLEPHDYQARILRDDSRNIAIRAAAKAGKTMTLAAKALHKALTVKKEKVYVISPGQRQSNMLFEPILRIIPKKKEIEDMLGVKNTQTEKFFVNDSALYCWSGGGAKKGDQIRGLEPGTVIIDEGAYVEENLWIVIEPRVELLGGTLIVSSTPGADVGRYFEMFSDTSEYSKYHISGYDVPHFTAEAIAKLKKKLAEDDFKREVLAEFVSELDNYFPRKLIDGCIGGYEIGTPEKEATYRLSVDFARFGSDETVFIIGEVIENTIHIKNMWDRKKQGTNVSADEIRELHKVWNFDMILLDETGMGG